MGHTRFEDLKDLQLKLEQVRALNGIKEKGAGIFYYKSIPFLHFHDKDGVRWADVKTSKGWLKVQVDFRATKKDRAHFMKKILEAYQRIAGK